MRPDNPRELLTALFEAGVRAVHPHRLIPDSVSIENDRLRVRTGNGSAARLFDLALSGRVLLVGAGKGAGAMAEALVTLLGDRVAGGCVIIPSEQRLSLPNVTVMHGEHPFPGPGSLKATEILLDSLAELESRDCVLFCLTGGASSLLASPARGLTLADLASANRVLVECGADIQAMNTVRKHLSRVKGGWLARQAQPAHVVSLILSDVVGDDLSIIGSGPTVADPTTFEDAWRVVDDYNLGNRLPAAVCSYLRQGLTGAHPDTPKPGDPALVRVYNGLIGSNRLALRAALTAAGRCGLRPHLIAEPLVGDTTLAARYLARHIRTLRRNCRVPTCVVGGGETTVEVRGDGKGGRNQEFALSVALELHDEPSWSLLSAGTDGIDGPTDAAGAFVDGTTLARAREKHLDPGRHLTNNDSYNFFSVLDDLFRPGSTGTNVMDIKLALIHPTNAET